MCVHMLFCMCEAGTGEVNARTDIWNLYKRHTPVNGGKEEKEEFVFIYDSLFMTW